MKKIEILDLNTGEIIRSLSIEDDDYNPNTISFSNVNNLIVTGSFSGIIKIWNYFTCELVNILEGHTDTITSISFSPDGSRIVSGSTNGTVKIWNSKTGELIQTLIGDNITSIISILFNYSNTRLISLNDISIVTLWNTESGELINKIKLNGGYTNLIPFNLNGIKIFTCTYNGIIKILDSETFEMIDILLGHSRKITLLIYSNEIPGSYI